MNPEKTRNFVETTWNQSILPTLSEYVAIPCKSPLFDPNWQAHGYITQAIELLSAWCRKQNVRGMELKVHQLEGRTPVLLLDIAGQLPETVLLYGHMDKQPEMTGWQEGLGPWQPIIKEDRLYGRGGADDGYALFSSLTAIKALQEQNIPHARYVILIENCEESGSYDLPHYVDYLKEQIGEPSLVICLDSGCGNYEQLWCTTSLRGLLVGVLNVEILLEGVHSGAASGVVPSSFRIVRQLLSRIEDENTGQVLLEDLKVAIPAVRQQEAAEVAKVLAEKVWTHYPWIEKAHPLDLPLEQLVLNRTWQPALSVTGVEGIPAITDAGNVLRPKTAFVLSMRIPPHCDPRRAVESLKKVLEENPPHGAKVSFEIKQATAGWDAPEPAAWLAKATHSASMTYFDQPAMYWGEGGTIPFMYMLSQKFPKTQFVITGVLGPGANAHGPNEFLNIPMAKKLTCCVAELLFAQIEQCTVKK